MLYKTACAQQLVQIRVLRNDAFVTALILLLATFHGRDGYKGMQSLIRNDALQQCHLTLQYVLFAKTVWCMSHGRLGNVAKVLP